MINFYFIFSLNERGFLFFRSFSRRAQKLLRKSKNDLLKVPTRCNFLKENVPFIEMLTPGAPYFLTTSGSLSSLPPSRPVAAGLCCVGLAHSTTTLFINPSLPIQL